MDSGAILKSLFNVTAFIKKTQLFIYDKSNIYSKSTNIDTCMYTQAMSKLRATPIERFYLYNMSLSHDCTENFIGCFLIRILRGTSIMYASPAHYNLCRFVMVVTQLQSIVIALHETWYI